MPSWLDILQVNLDISNSPPLFLSCSFSPRPLLRGIAAPPSTLPPWFPDSTEQQLCSPLSSPSPQPRQRSEHAASSRPPSRPFLSHQPPRPAPPASPEPSISPSSSTMRIRGWEPSASACGGMPSFGEVRARRYVRPRRSSNVAPVGMGIKASSDKNAGRLSSSRLVSPRRVDLEVISRIGRYRV